VYTVADIDKREATLADEADDAELVAQVASGSRQAFNRVLSRHLNGILSFSMRYVRQRSDAEDIAQETFTRLWLHAKRLNAKPHSLRSWLYRVAYNLCMDWYRKDKYDSLDDADGALACEETPETLAIRYTEQTMIHSAVGALPERQRTALWLCTYHGLTNKEAAEILGTSIHALESILARARRTLRQTMNEQHVSGNNEYDETG